MAPHTYRWKMAWMEGVRNFDALVRPGQHLLLASRHKGGSWRYAGLRVWTRQSAGAPGTKLCILLPLSVHVFCCMFGWNHNNSLLRSSFVPHKLFLVMLLTQKINQKWVVVPFRYQLSWYFKVTSNKYSHAMSGHDIHLIGCYYSGGVLSFPTLNLALSQNLNVC